MKITLNIDNVKYQHKPSQYAGSIRNRLGTEKSIVTITPEEFMECIKNGQSFTPGAMTGTKGETWKSQQIICVDVDNKEIVIENGEKIARRVSNPLFPETAKLLLSEYNIVPYFMYYSFSNGKDWPRYRIVVILDKPITDGAKAIDLTNRIANVLNESFSSVADTGVSDNARFFYGGKADGVFYISGETTTIETLEGLPVPAPAPKDQGKTERQQDKKTTTSAPVFIGKYAELQEQFKRDKAAFDLPDYIERVTGSKRKKRGNALFYVPCPICGGGTTNGGSFHITLQDGYVWHCFSDSHKKKCDGDVIDFLEQYYDLNTGDACDKFKFEIMGYDRDEWKKAYWESVQAENDARIEREYQQSKKTAAEQTTSSNENTVTADSSIEKTEEEDRKTYLENAASMSLSGFMGHIEESKNTPETPTGFKTLDKTLDGGLYEGLYIMGAISSLGKTTFMLQIADQIAESGKDVLYFSLEMARYEVIAKSISRETYIQSGHNKYQSKTVRDILNGKRWNKFLKKDFEVIDKAMDHYGTYAGNVYIHEGVGNIGIKEVTETIKKHIAFTRRTPVVFIDYLQILAPYDLKMTDKQNTDKNVVELKRLTRELKLSVFAISSFNRENYFAPVDFASFKESGAIEYSSDVLIGLQWDGMDWVDGEKPNQRLFRIARIREENSRKKKDRDPIRIQLKVLKNRNGETNSHIFLNYVPAFNYYEDDGSYRPRAKSTAPAKANADNDQEINFTF